MYKVILKKIKTNHNRVRTDSITGECDRLPQEGRSFSMFAEPLDPTVGNMRFVQTSPVVSVDTHAPKEITFNTNNSEYCLELIGNEFN